VSKIEAQRRELRLRMGHAFGHSQGNSTFAHDHLNIDGFMRELEKYIDLRIEEALASRRVQWR
jgi:hypothetical protein